MQLHGLVVTLLYRANIIIKLYDIEWYAHSEAILQAMLTSEDRQQRLKAVEKIMEIRGRGRKRARLVIVL